MRAAWAIGMVIGMVACHRAPEVEPWPTREVGEYSFRLTATPVSGKFTILADTLAVEAQEQSCRRIGTEMRNQVVHPFRCTGGSMAFTLDQLEVSVAVDLEDGDAGDENGRDLHAVQDHGRPAELREQSHRSEGGQRAE